MDYLTHDILHTEYGDINLDGKVDDVDVDYLSSFYVP